VRETLRGKKLTSFVLISSLAFLASAFAISARASRVDCQIWRDPQGVTHVKAESDESLYACFGYVHARERAFEMEMLRRMVEGRTAEILGASAVKDDFAMRVIEIPRRAKELAKGLQGNERRILESYVNGVNRGLHEAAKTSYEFRHFHLKPRTWTLADSVGLLYLKSLSQTKASFESQLEEQELFAKWGQRARGFLSEEGLPWATTILKPGEFEAKKRESVAAHDRSRSPAATLRAGLSPAELRDFFSAYSSPAAGSNNWVLSPAHTRSHVAWLANDPHVGITIPPFFHWIHLSGPDFDAIGASVPGLPLIVSGTNRFVSWGLTNANPVTSRLLFVKKENLRGGTRVRPWIWFRTVAGLKLPFFLKTYQRTPQGWPVLPLTAPKGYALVLKWSSFDLGPDDLKGFFEMMPARSGEDMARALADVGLPSWNFVYADVGGHIGYRAVGRIARLAQAPAYGIPFATNEDLGPVAFPDILSDDEAPHVFDPARGYILSANNRQWSEIARFSVGRAHDPSFRAFRIQEMLGKRTDHDFDSLREIQCDTQAVDARFLVPRLLDFLSSTGGLHPLQAALRNWDFEAKPECRECALFRRWMDRLEEDEKLANAGLYRLLSYPDADPELRQRLNGAFEHALEDLGASKLTRIEDLKPWSELHVNFFEHLGGSAFRADPLPTWGDAHTIDLGHAEWDPKLRLYRDGDAPVHRLLVEMTSPPRVYARLAGDNQDAQAPRRLDAENSPWRNWRDCKYDLRLYPLDWSQVPAQDISWNVSGESYVETQVH
jgi:penicillin amidase